MSAHFILFTQKGMMGEHVFLMAGSLYEICCQCSVTDIKVSIIQSSGIGSASQQQLSTPSLLATE